ncbi:MAG: hypothetical protein V4582_10745 [Pseudomonadota bacterium]
MDGNHQLQCLLDEQGLAVTELVRHVLWLEDPQGRILVAHRNAQIGSVTGDAYLGWEMVADCWWGSDLWDEDVFDAARATASEYTGLDLTDAEPELIDVFHGASQGVPFLHLVYRICLDDTKPFEFWGEHHDEARWLDPREAAQLVACEEDRRIISQWLARRDTSARGA